MELVKDLPSIFEEFSEQRKNAFLRMHELKQQGKPFVGGFCTYLPKEVPMAMGACMVGLCSKDGETNAKACKESVLLFLLRPDSIIATAYSEPQALTEIDEVILKLLYPPDMFPGYSYSQCAEVIPAGIALRGIA